MKVLMYFLFAEVLFALTAFLSGMGMGLPEETYKLMTVIITLMFSPMAYLFAKMNQ